MLERWSAAVRVGGREPVAGLNAAAVPGLETLCSS